MTDSTSPQGDTDPASDPDYTQLGDQGNSLPESDDANSTDVGIDQVPSGGEDASEGEQNAPLPDWGPTDGSHGVDGVDPAK